MNPLKRLRSQRTVLSSFENASTAKVGGANGQNKVVCNLKHIVWEAYELVNANKGAAGVDEESIQKFEANLKDNLYKIWNRMSSGRYFPPPVKAVEIPKKNGGVRIIGVPTVSNRIAQMTAKLYFEPRWNRFSIQTLTGTDREIRY